MDGQFIKFTNNNTYKNMEIRRDVMDVLTAFSHYTYQCSNEQLMVTDLQGWMPVTGDGLVILTDPAINCSSYPSSFNATNMGDVGLAGFWQEQHATCNDICHQLRLVRPDRYCKEI